MDILSDPSNQSQGTTGAPASNTLTGQAKPKFWGSGVIGAISDVGAGAGKDIWQAGVGLGQLAVSGAKAAAKLGQPLANKVGLGNVQSGIVSGLEKTGQTLGGPVKNFFNTPETNTTSGKIGGVLGDVAMLSDPSLAKFGSDAKAGIQATGLYKGLAKAPGAVKPLSYIASKVLTAIPDIATGFTYGKVKGQSNKQAAETGATFGIISAGLEMAGDTVRAIKGSLPDNIGKAFGFGGKTTLADATTKVTKSKNALETLANLSDDITVIDDAGNSAKFNPSKATFSDMTQAVKQGKDQLYQTYSDLAAQAGDKGATFTEADFTKVIDTLNGLKENATGSTITKVDSLIADLQRNYGTGLSDNAQQYIQALNKAAQKGGEGGDIGMGINELKKMFPELPKLSHDEAASVGHFIETQYFGAQTAGENLPTTGAFSNTSFEDIQKFIEKVNTDVNPGSDRAGAVASQKLSQTMREILDSKIASASGGKYQALRTKYSELKAIEDDVIRQWKKAARGTKGFSTYIDLFGDLDTITSIITRNPTELIRGAGLKGIAAIVKYLRDPQVALQNAFKQIMSAGKVVAPSAGGTAGKALLEKTGSAIYPGTNPPSVGGPTQ